MPRPFDRRLPDSRNAQQHVIIQKLPSSSSGSHGPLLFGFVVEGGR